ncbi:hypothetical protein [Fredinandcohnia sp. 179-A 10B2 NHS]|uniref:hypothetical protein n=1 Tax=Fredinandcohnia sp. 179-A 10B2 NHS TaxID=3235176 RepID=UPI0039A02ECD
MKKKKHVLIGIFIALALLMATRFFDREVWEENASALSDSFEIISGKEALIEDLSDWTKFEWDTLYSFAPYTPKETIYETVGYKWDEISETVNEGMNQLVFIHDGKVVCYLYGYPERNKISFNFGSYEGSYITLSAAEELAFNMTVVDEVKYLEYIK